MNAENRVLLQLNTLRMQHGLEQRVMILQLAVL